MASGFNLSLNTSPQIFTVVGGSIGSQFAMLAFQTAPSVCTVKFEYRLIGSSLWVTVKTNVDLSSGETFFQFEGAIAAFRVTFLTLTGGSAPTLWVTAQPVATPPLRLITDGGTGLSGRLRVDPGQTGFFAGKFFRSYLPLVIPTAGPSVQFRFTSPIDFILWQQTLELTQGATQLNIYTGSTPSGSWTQLPVIGVNRMLSRPQPYYVAQCTFETGGNFSGGTEVDLLQVRTAAQNNSASNVGLGVQERGLPPGTYYGRLQTLAGGLQVNDAAQLIYSLLWEERT